MRRIGMVVLVALGLQAILLSFEGLDLTNLTAPSEMLVIALSPSLALVFLGIFLIRSRRRLAERWFQDTPFDISVDAVSLLRLAMIFVGLLFFTRAIVSIIATIFVTISRAEMFGEFSMNMGVPSIGKTLLYALVTPVFQVLIGLLLMLRSDYIANRLWQMGREEAVEPVPTSQSACPHCGTPYDPEEYLPGVEAPQCSACEGRLDLDE